MSSLLATKVSNWAAACATIIIDANITKGFVGENGNEMPEFNNYTWGVDAPTCYKYCGKDKIYQAFDFETFSGAFTNWLLPWLALTAQLPFEAKSSLGNLMSLFMAVGSPALITYSLTLTILNRIWVRRIFRSLLKQLDDLSKPPLGLRERLRERLRAAQYLLQESQQVPMRASQVDGWLSSLIVLDDNDAWWVRVKKDLQNSRRGYTFSLVAQIGMALVAYTFTIVTSLSTSQGGNSEGSQVILTAGGGIWIWMIPVIWGWIMCGTQARARSITEALEDQTDPPFCVSKGGEIVQNGMQYGIRSRSGLIPRPPLIEPSSTISSSYPDASAVTGNLAVTGRDDFNNIAGAGETIDRIDFVERSGTTNLSGSSSTAEQKETSQITVANLIPRRPRKRPLGHLETLDFESLECQRWLGFSLQGDEAREGPLFNYARLFTFRQFSSTITNAFSATLASLNQADSENSESSEMDLFEVAESCKLDNKYLQAYTPWRNIDSMVWHHMLIAVSAAIFVQWGTTGPALMMGYLTPTVGLGCRSGSYLFYGVGATVSWALLISSSLLSHAVNLRYQEIYQNPRLFSPRKQNRHVEDGEESSEMMLMEVSSRDSKSIDLSVHKRTTWHSTLAFWTVATRAAGKLVAAMNACWIVISAIFEYTGVYSSCWCETDADIFGYRGWAVLFVTPEVFHEESISYWTGGVIFSFGVCFLAYLGFYLGCQRNDVNEHDD